MKTCMNGATTMPYPLEEDIRAAGNAGFEQIEIWLDKMNKYLETHSEGDLKRLLDANGVSAATICPFWMVMFGDREPQLAAIGRAAEIASRIGCPTLLVCPDAPPPTMSTDAAFEHAGQVAREYGDVAAKHGVRIAIEPLGTHPFVPGCSEALRILEIADHPALGLMMDTFHYYKSGVPMESVRKIPADKLLIVHVNDCEDRPRQELQDSHRLYLGEGILPLTETLQTLKAIGYEGALSVEIFRPEYWERPIDRISRESFESLRKAVAAAGMEV
ncbi:MAG TPA: sugar phosphate isomerase/epimerase family protein [Armatimonadota bacterium]|nr:sugar phosphate isomerase/epimerase family protein [Armatimonadota bacterium]